jgi:hypothetical protein
MRRLTAREGCFLQRTTLVRNVSALRNTRKRHGAVESGQSAMILAWVKHYAIRVPVSRILRNLLSSFWRCGRKWRSDNSTGHVQSAYPPTNRAFTFSTQCGGGLSVQWPIGERTSSSWRVQFQLLLIEPRPLRCSFETFIILPPRRPVTNAAAFTSGIGSE